MDLINKLDGADVFAAGGCKDCNVFPRCTLEAPCEACPATSCYALLHWRSHALVLSLSFLLYILQVQTCLEPKGYLLFLLKECWI